MTDSAASSPSRPQLDSDLDIEDLEDYLHGVAALHGDEDEDDEGEDEDEDEDEDAAEDDDDGDYVDEDDLDHDDDDDDDLDMDAGLPEVVNLQFAGGDEDDVQNVTLTRDQLLRLIFSRSQVAGILRESADRGENSWRRGRGRPSLDPNRFPKVPSDTGTELMHSGVFGVDDDSPTSKIRMRKAVARRILDREMGVGVDARQRINRQLLTQSLIPSSAPLSIIHYDHPVYSGQFSDDGNFYFCAVKDLRIRMYDTSNPYKWRYYKTLEFPFAQWTLTDASLSPDNKYLAYSSLDSKVALAPTDPNDLGDPYSLELGDTRRHEYSMFSPGSLSVFSIRFSGDGRELVAGTRANSICVYDIEARQSVFHLRGHTEDVNAVCFADKNSPHILYSGSDDTTVKVWDRRSMRDTREAGAFVGHTEGVTYIDSKGDGRYILSNGKEQSMKLWDLRMAMSTARFAELHLDSSNYSTGYDYRYETYDNRRYEPHPYDNSLVTFRGHRIKRTLIRCHFSPPGSTNARYVFSGSADGKVYVWNLDGTIAGTIDVQATTRAAAEASGRPDLWRYDGPRMNMMSRSQWTTCVRDVAWHPTAPLIAASSLNGIDMSCGSLTLHSWNGGADRDEAMPRMATVFDSKLRPVEAGAAGR